MAKLPKGNHKVTLSEIKQEIDLEHYLKRKPTKSELKKFGEAAVERINSRTLDGKRFDDNRKKFQQYSEAYANAKGVTKDSVDLFLEGDMLDSLDHDNDGSSVQISLDGGDQDINIKKGYNHHVGDTLPKRPWFGLSENETKKIVNEIKEKPRKETQQARQGRTLADLRTELEKLGIRQVE